MADPRLRAAALAVLLAMISSGARAAETAWLDLEARIQYGFYTEDTRALTGLRQTIAEAHSAEPLGLYYGALASYRLAQLHAAQHRDAARAAADHCVTSLDRALRLQAEFPDALALQSACLLAAASWRAPLAGSRSGAKLARAVQLAPKNPRVLLVEAVDVYERAAASPTARAAALNRLQRAVAAFEAERQGVGAVPGWGAAEAYTFLARSHLEQGDPLAARSALERALLIAPEYTEARRLLARIVSG